MGSQLVFSVSSATNCRTYVPLQWFIEFISDIWLMEFLVNVAILGRMLTRVISKKFLA